MDDLTPEQAEELNADLACLREELRRLVEASGDGARPVDLDQPIGL